MVLYIAPMNNPKHGQRGETRAALGLLRLTTTPTPECVRPPGEVVSDHAQTVPVDLRPGRHRLPGHVDKAGVAALEGHGHGLGRAVAVLGDDEVRLAHAGRLLLVQILAV